ncbi:MAG: NnrS family protein [Nitrospira sp.]|nr:NnrS family protein [Nitrospira sp.]
MADQPAAAEQPGDDEPTFPQYEGPAFLSYGFRPFFLGAALFTSLAVLVWIALFAGRVSVDFLYPPREWHVHEMLFGYLPALIAGFLLTAIPNWTDRMPLRGGAAPLTVPAVAGGTIADGISMGWSDDSCRRGWSLFGSLGHLYLARNYGSGELGPSADWNPCNPLCGHKHSVSSLCASRCPHGPPRAACLVSDDTDADRDWWTPCPHIYPRISG